jgi:hypothetical protein
MRSVESWMGLSKDEMDHMDVKSRAVHQIALRLQTERDEEESRRLQAFRWSSLSFQWTPLIKTIIFPPKKQHRPTLCKFLKFGPSSCRSRRDKRRLKS